MIYFAQHQSRIKIGFAASVAKRLNAMRTVAPGIVLLVEMEGTRGHERTMHRALSAYSVGREWFEDCAEVRDYMENASANGVEEWKSARVHNYKPTMWDERAKQLAIIICSNRPKSELKKIEQEFSIASGTLWFIRYRQSREVSVGEYFALLAGARETIRRQREELERSHALVSDLEREDAEKCNRTFDIDRVYASARAVVGEDS